MKYFFFSFFKVIKCFSFIFFCPFGLKEDENHGNITTNIHGTLFIINFLFIFLLSLSCTLPFLSFELKNNYNDCFNTIVYHIRLLFTYPLIQA
ncbi:hypothetical protein PFBG_02798 [Plasmodium falciparum 7G8]|uniref:Uncharacterized protein n=1 Tax=Plasmodium falciparum (isolate 7G8) TaxID=57266 RepID=W7F105_PLAF8|nr:hypothetical protein PFBG_02798 [Plasmodium falciparum 7G8]